MSRQVKPGSKPYRAQLRDRLTGLGFPLEAIPAQVAECLLVECGIRPRIAWRLASELSLDLAAHRFNALTGDSRAAMRGSRIWEYEQWPDRGVRPTLQALRVLAQVYGTVWRSLLDLRDLEQLSPADLAEYHTAPPTAQPAPGGGAAQHGPPGVAGVSAVVVDDRMDTLAAAMALTTTNVDEVQLDDLWSDLEYVAGAYARTPPDSMMRQLSVVHDRVAMLLRGRQRPKQTRDLYLVNAKCCAMMAWTSADLGRYGHAQELNAAAWLYTQYADDVLARRWVRTSQARVEYWAGNGVESARLAADGLRYEAGERLIDMPLILAEARGWSSVGAEPKVLDAIGRWSRIEESAPPVIDDDRFFNISKDRRHYVAGTALLSVGRTDLALQEFRVAREVFDELAPEYRWEAMEPMIRIDTGRALLRSGALDAAAAEIEPMLSADVARQPDMVRAMMKVLATELADSRWRSVKAARDLGQALAGAQEPHPG